MKDGPRQHGMTLVEMMISMVLGLLVIGATMTIFAQVKRSYNENDRALQLQDDARLALNELGRDLAMTGFWGELTDPGSVFADASLTVATDCGAGGAPWVYDFERQLSTVDNATAASATAQFDCIDGGTVVPGTDLVGIKRTVGNDTPLPLENGVVYLKSNGVIGLMLQHPEAVPAGILVPAPFQHWSYSPSIWYVRTHWDDNNAADGIPSLCRKRLDDSGVPSMVDECLVPGVEDLQIEFGVDTDGDGTPDQYLADPDTAILARALSARITLLMRSMTPQTGYLNSKTYQLGNQAAYTPADNFVRRVYSTTVAIRNLRNQNRL